MSEDPTSSFCFVCCRNLGESRTVKGNTRLRHSNKLIDEVISDILNEPVTAPKLCFRCYRVVLGIDYHQHEFNRLMQSFTRIFSERILPRGNNEKNCVIEVINNSDILNSKLAEVEAQIEESCNNVTISIDEHIGTKINDPDVESLQLEFFGDDSREAVAYIPPTVENQCESVEGEVGDGDRKKFGDPNFDSDIIKPERNDLDLMDEILIQPRRRQKVPKKYDDYEYYSESYSQKNVDFEGKEISAESLEFHSPFKCNLCQNFFTSKKSFNCHQCFKKEKEEITYSCKGCQETFAVRRDYMKHIELCYKNVPVECHLCLSKLPSAAYLPRHLEAFHKGVSVNKKNTLCEHCGEGFSRKESLERHQARVHGLAHGIHQCPECGCTFLHTSLLAEHMRAHRGYTCTVCNKSFSCMSNLNLHSKAHHQKVTSYTCSECNKSWKFHASYTYHMRKVHGSSLIKCSVCKECFSTQRGLLHHQKKCKSSQNESTAKTSVEEKIDKEPVQSKVQSSSVKASSSTMQKHTLRTKRVRANLSSALGNKNPKTKKETVDVCERFDGQEQQINMLNLQSTLNPTEEVSIHSREEGNDIMETGNLTVEVAEMPTEPKDSLLLVPELPEEDELIYEVEEEEAMAGPSDNIVVETLDDLTNDCHYVILVEEGSDGMD